MTPLELGLLGAGVLLFGVPSSTVGVAPRWGGAIGLALGGSFLALGAGNLFLLQWWGSTAALPHGSGVIGFFRPGVLPSIFIIMLVGLIRGAILSLFFFFFLV